MSGSRQMTPGELRLTLPELGGERVPAWMKRRLDEADAAEVEAKGMKEILEEEEMRLEMTYEQ